MAAKDPFTLCAGALWTLTKSWKAADNQPDTLASARAALAKLFLAVDGAGFPTRAEPDLDSQSWKDCVDAARTALPDGAAALSPEGRYALLWSADPNNQQRPGDQQHLGLNWPFLNVSSIAAVYGPIKDDTGATRSLFFYSAVDQAAALKEDGDARPGLWPSFAGPARSAAAKGRLALATALFVAFILLGIGTALWVWAIADFARDTAVAFAGPNPVAGTVNVAGDCLPTEKMKALATWTQTCSGAWLATWQARKPNTETDGSLWNRIRDFYWSWSQPTPNGQLSLTMPLLGMMVALLLLVLAGGIAKNGLWFGALIDDRNRISLSRAQQASWVILLLAGIAILGLFNGGLLAAPLRDLSLGGNAAASTALRIFPSMDGALWAALGISIAASPWLSAVILNRKDSEGEVQVVAPTAVPPDDLHKRLLPVQASLADLFTGETTADAGTVDISRLQHLIITGMLLFQYFMLLASYVGDIDGSFILTSLALGTGSTPALPASPFGSMPPVDSTFLSLLVLSHGAYLAFKAMPKSGT